MRLSKVVNSSATRAIPTIIQTHPCETGGVGRRRDLPGGVFDPRGGMSNLPRRPSATRPRFQATTSGYQTRIRLTTVGVRRERLEKSGRHELVAAFAKLVA